ncbi:MAG: peptidoglycan DD-metalloendopeptidase family protein [Rhodospirillales bacterium]|nr:peptidoglycan DD-metalloendopeptidase family protein [Rhodospirillales bacterium]
MEAPSTVRSGQSVAAGVLLGYLGDTGRARGTPPHLHYQVSIRNDRGALQSFLNPYPDLFRLAVRWQPQVSAGGCVVIPVSQGGPSG